MFTRQLSLAAIALLAIACTEAPLGLKDTGIVIEPPIPQSPIQVTPLAPEPGVAVRFDSGNLGAGTRSWTFGDGGSDTGVVVMHVFQDAGRYEVQVLVDDGQGVLNQHTVSLLVEDGGREPELSAARRARR